MSCLALRSQPAVWQSTKDNWPLVNKDHQELTIYYYVSILVIITKNNLEREVKSYSEDHYTSTNTYV